MDYFETGFFANNEPAWHRAGHVFPDAPSIEDAMRLGELDWIVEEHDIYKQNIFAHDDDENPGAYPVSVDYEKVPRYKALVRSTDKRVLSVVRKTYQPLQNVDAFNWFRPFIEDGSVSLEAGGSLKGGEYVWVLAKINIDPADIAPDDIVVPYFLLSNAHNGLKAVWLQFTKIRVVCWNTLSSSMRAAEDGKEKMIRIQHKQNMIASLEAVRDTVDLARRDFIASVEQYRRMQRQQLQTEGLKQYVRDVFKTPKDEDRMPRAYEKIESNFESGQGSKTHRGTVWGAYNAITEWLDHQRGRSDETRLYSTWYGPSATMRDRAYDKALELIA